MKRILVPSDFSDNAYRALYYATHLFKEKACEFYILNTFDVDTPILTSRLDTSKGNLLYQQRSKASKEGLTNTLNSIKEEAENFDHTFETISISKKLTETINKTIKSKNIDLVVMGTKGASGVKEVFMGSNTVKMIQKIKGCPILTVPDEFDFTPPKEVAFATDFKHSYSKKEIQPILNIAALFNAKIRVMHIHDAETLSKEQEENFKRLKEHLAAVEYTTHWVSKFDQKAQVIKEFIEKMDINILTMLYHKHGFIENITREPVVKKIGFKASIPFMVIPEMN